MHRCRAIIAVLLTAATLASGLHVPVVYHGGSGSDPGEERVHIVVHRHHGRLHAHVHHHGEDCLAHHDQAGDRDRAGGADDGCHGEECETDHAPELWLSSSRSDWRDAAALGRLAEFAIEAAPPLGAAGSDSAQRHGRAPPGRASPAAHLEMMRPIVLLL